MFKSVILSMFAVCMLGACHGETMPCADGTAGATCVPTSPAADTSAPPTADPTAAPSATPTADPGATSMPEHETLADESARAAEPVCSAHPENLVCKPPVLVSQPVSK